MNALFVFALLIPFMVTCAISATNQDGVKDLIRYERASDHGLCTGEDQNQEFPCPVHFTHFKRFGTCLQAFMNETLTFHESESKCQEMGAQLIMINDPSFDEALKEWRHIRTDTVWIGLRFNNDIYPGVWVAENETQEFFHWPFGKWPDLHDNPYVFKDMRHGSWGVSDWSEKRTCICQIRSGFDIDQVTVEVDGDPVMAKGDTLNGTCNVVGNNIELFSMSFYDEQTGRDYLTLYSVNDDRVTLSDHHYIRVFEMCVELATLLVNTTVDFRAHNRKLKCCGYRKVDVLPMCGTSKKNIQVVGATPTKPEITLKYITDDVLQAKCIGYTGIEEQVIWGIGDDFAMTKFCDRAVGYEINPKLEGVKLYFGNTPIRNKMGFLKTSVIRIALNRHLEGKLLTCSTLQEPICTDYVTQFMGALNESLRSKVLTLPTFSAQPPVIRQAVDRGSNKTFGRVMCQAYVGTNGELLWVYDVPGISVAMWKVNLTSSKDYFQGPLGLAEVTSTQQNYSGRNGVLFKSTLRLDLTELEANLSSLVVTCYSKDPTDQDYLDTLINKTRFDFSLREWRYSPPDSRNRIAVTFVMLFPVLGSVLMAVAQVCRKKKQKKESPEECDLGPEEYEKEVVIEEDHPARVSANIMSIIESNIS